MSTKKGDILKGFFVIGLLLLVLVILAYAATTTQPNSVIVNELSNKIFNITINNTYDVDNVTQVNFTLPAGFAFITNTNWTNAIGYVTFINVSTTNLSFSNITYGGQLILNLTNETSFWFNASAPIQSAYYNITIMVLYVSGGVDYSNLSVTVNDTIAPNGSTIHSPINNGNYSGNLLLNASVNDTNGFGMSNVYFNISNSSFSNFTIAVQLAAGSYHWAATTNTAAYGEGLYNLTVYANDTSNNVNNSGFVQFTIDNTAPAANITMPANNYNYSGTIILNASVSDTLLEISSVYFNVSNTTFSNFSIATREGTSTNYSLAFTSTILGSGKYNVTVYANDTAGNINSTSLIHIIIDNTAPATNITMPANNYNYSGTIILNASVSDTLLEISSVYFNVSNSTFSNFSIATREAGTNWSLKFTSSILKDGLYNVTVYANDTLGNMNSTSRVQIGIDNTYPAISWGNGIADDWANVSRNWTYANVTYTEANLANVTFVLFNDTSQVNSTNYASATYTVNWTLLPEGNYTYWVNVTDIVGHINSNSIKHITLDVSPPIVSSSCLPVLTTVGDVVTCTCSATDRFSKPTWSQVANPSTATAGTFTVPCTATDSAGNSAVANPSYTITSPSSGGGGSGGGAGGTSATINTASSGEAVSFDFAKEGVYVDKVVLTPSADLTNAKVSVAESTKSDIESKVGYLMPSITGNVVQYLKIEANGFDNSKIKGFVDVSFKVPKSQLVGKDAKNVALFRFSNGKWAELSTSVVKQDSSYAYFVAKTPGFSYFAIAVKKAQPKEAAKQETTPQGEVSPETNTENPPVEPTTVPKKSYWKTIVITLLAVLVIVVLFYLVYRAKNKR